MAGRAACGNFLKQLFKSSICEAIRYRLEAHMNILNIHGYAGTYENTNYTIMHEAGYKVTGFTIDYDSCQALDVENFLSSAIKVYNIGLIVATSYGSFFANILSARFDIPFIATNPCVDPSVSLLKISPEYCMREMLYFKRRKEDYYNNWRKGIFILGNEDEVIDHTITESVIGDARKYKVQGGHKLNRFTYESLLLKEINIYTRQRYTRINKK